jgi:hypothetical protein
MIDADTLRSLLEYDPDTGVFTWRVKRGGSAWPGVISGCLKDSGYRVISIYNRLYSAHRLAWLYMYDVWPSEEIDHINGVRDDNRINNLREATRKQNSANRRKFGGDLPKGVTRHWRRFRAQIRIQGRVKHLGIYDTPEQAHAAYCEAAQKEFGAYHRAG